MAVVIDFPADVAHNDFLLMLDKWVGNKGTRVISSEVVEAWS